MPATDTHRVIEPRVLYFGTPVVLVSTTNENGSPNLAPMSSAWWVGSSCLLGLDETSQTTVNLRRTGELVLNLPDSGMVAAVDRMARFTGARVVPPHKQSKGYTFHGDKFAVSELTPVAAVDVVPPRVAECAIQLEARVEDVRPFGGEGSGVVAVEVRVVRTHVAVDLLGPEPSRHIDPDRWDPLIMKFTHFYGGGRNLQTSRLADAWEVPAPLRAAASDGGPGWEPTLVDGVERAHALTGADVTVWRMAAGASFEEHGHERDELLVLTKGELRFHDGTWARPGDVVRASRGETHGAVARGETEFYVLAAGGPAPARTGGP